jgi:hypothetical protein
MIVRFVSLVSLICAIAIASVNVQNPSDPLFFIVSGGVAADTARILLAGLMVAGSFFRIPKTMHPEIFLTFFGSTVILIGLGGFITNSLSYNRDFKITLVTVIPGNYILYRYVTYEIAQLYALNSAMVTSRGIEPLLPG